MTMIDITLRDAVWEDRGVLFEWRNDLLTRRNSFNSRVVAWEDHIDWFRKRLQDDSTRIYMAFSPICDTLVGVIRFDFESPQVATISIQTAPFNRRQGYGQAILDAGVDRVFGSTMAEELTAEIKIPNPGSEKIFERGGFVDVDKPTVRTMVKHR